jgi:hypothetical protein
MWDIEKSFLGTGFERMRLKLEERAEFTTGFYKINY